MGSSESEIKITGEPSLDPNVCTFTVDRPIYLNRSFNCRTKEMAQGSPLLEALFTIEGVTEVFVSDTKVTVAKSTHEEWPAIGRKIGTALRSVIQAGGPLLAENLNATSAEGPNLTSPEATAIQKLLDDQINPAVASHGGHVTLVDVKNDTAYVRLEGGCQGCGMADVTLKQGITTAIKQAVATIREVLDVTEHASGTNPYYQPSKS